jgi:hypothetical protein
MRKWVIIACVSFSIAAGSFLAYVRWCAILYAQESMFYWEGDGHRSSSRCLWLMSWPSLAPPSFALPRCPSWPPRPSPCIADGPSGIPASASHDAIGLDGVRRKLLFMTVFGKKVWEFCM